MTKRNKIVVVGVAIIAGVILVAFFASSPREAHKVTMREFTDSAPVATNKGHSYTADDF